MVRERTPARRAGKSAVEDSWVIESDGDDEYTPPTAMSGSAQNHYIRKSRLSAEPFESPRKQPQRKQRSSAEPEFIMPSIHHNGSVTGSWLGEEKNMEPRQRQRPLPPSSESTRRPANRRTTMAEQATLKDSASDVVDLLWSSLRPILIYLRDIVAGVFQYLKTPIVMILAAYFLVGVVFFLRNLAINSIATAISPICRIPGMSLLGLSFCHSSIPVTYQDSENRPPVQFDQLMHVQDRFDEILQEAAGGAGLPLDMKRGETSIRDLRQLVKYSTLRSRNELELEFGNFIETARIAAYDLGRFNSHVGRSVDNILATARWTKRVLDGIAERDAGRGAISAFVSDKIMAPFQPIKFNEDMLLEQYLQHTRAVEDEVLSLVQQAQALLLLLQNLEDRLDVIHGIAIREDIQARGSKDEMLGQLWTMLGGNKSKLGKYDSQLRLLSQVHTYRQNAFAHVSGTLVKLQGIGAELEELRERVGGVELLGTKGPVSLLLHIENIEMGVERLEKGRKDARQLEQEELQRKVGQPGDGAKLIEEQ